MKNYFIFIIFCFCFKSFAQEVYQNDSYEFKISGNTFELNHRNDVEEFLYERRKSFCPLIAKGNLKKEDKFYYSLTSIYSSELFKTKLLKSDFKEGLNDSISITIKIENFNSLDYQNFTFSNFDGFYRISLKEINNDLVELRFTIPKVRVFDVKVLAYPENKNLLLSDDVIGLSFSNQLIINIFRYDLSSLKHEYNDFYFEIENFNPCNLYLKYFDGDLVKIKNNKLHWKNMVFEKK